MITCIRCGHEHPSNRIYDETPCKGCGKPITAFMTVNGARMSEAEYLAILDEPTLGEMIPADASVGWTRLTPGKVLSINPKIDGE